MENPKEFIIKAIEWGLQHFTLTDGIWGIGYFNGTWQALGIRSCLCPISMVILYDQNIHNSNLASQSSDICRAASYILGIPSYLVEKFVFGFDDEDKYKDNSAWYQLGKEIREMYKDRLRSTD